MTRHSTKPSRKQGAIFPGQTTFLEAFPEVENVEVVVHESGPGNQGLGLRRFNRLTFREFLNCSNSACSGRALSLGDILRDLTRRRSPGIRLRRSCEGMLEKGGSCPNAFELEISLLLKPGISPGVPPTCC